MRLAATAAAPLALALAVAACGSPQRPPLVLAPMPTTVPATTVRPTLAPRPTVTTTTAAPVTAPPTAPASETTAAAAAEPTTATTRGGISVRIPAPPSPATAPPAGSEPSATTATTVVKGTVAANPLQLVAPAARRLPDGAFDVAVSGATAFAVVAQPAAVCAVDGARVVPMATGACVLRATATGHTAAEATVQIERGDPVVTWKLGATTAFTFGAVPMGLASSSGGTVRATEAKGSCKLQDPGTLSFAAAGATQVGPCTVTATVDEGPLWNAATVTLSTTTTAAVATASLEVPAAAVKSFTVRAVLTQGDRTLDTHTAFSLKSAGGCALTVSPATPAAGSRAATINVTAIVGTSRWCPLTLVPSVTDAGGVLRVTVPACRWTWVGVGSATAPAPTACP